MNHKWVYWLYRAEGLQVARRRRKQVAGSRTIVLRVIQHANQQWAMDFVQDTTAAGQSFRVLTLVDTYTRECHAIEVARSLPSERVIRVLERMMMHGRPERIRVDNGPEFVSRASTNGRHDKAPSCTSSRPGNRWRTDISRVSTGNCGTNA